MSKAAPTPATVPWIGIAPMRMQLLEAYHECLDAVCREKKFLMLAEAPPIGASRKFVQSLLESNLPMLVAFTPGPTIVGWCDIYSPPYESQAHIGRLGMGVKSDFRGQGIGPALLERTLKLARLAGLERVELEVFASNTTAIRLYKSFDFKEEGLKRKARKMDSVYEDILMMAKCF